MINKKQLQQKKKRIIKIIQKKILEAGNLPEKYDKYCGGNDYALLLDLEDVLRILEIVGVEFTEDELEKF